MLARLQLSRTSCDLPATLHKISLGSPHLFLGSTASLLQRFTLPSRFCRALRDVVDGVAPAPPSDRMESAICMSGLVGVARDRFAVVDQRVLSSWDTFSTPPGLSWTSAHWLDVEMSFRQCHFDVQPMSGRPG